MKTKIVNKFSQRQCALFVRGLVVDEWGYRFFVLVLRKGQ